MLHVATLYFVPGDGDTFVKSIRIGGHWHSIARRVAPSLIATDVLQHQTVGLHSVYLCLDYWISPEAYIQVRQSPLYEPLFLLRSQITASTCALELGAFAFPPADHTDVAHGQLAVICNRKER